MARFGLMLFLCTVYNGHNSNGEFFGIKTGRLFSLFYCYFTFYILNDMNRTQSAYANKWFKCIIIELEIHIYAVRWRWWWLREHFIIIKHRIKDCKMCLVGKTRRNRKSWRKSVGKVTNCNGKWWKLAAIVYVWMLRMVRQIQKWVEIWLVFLFWDYIFDVLKQGE